MCVTDATHDAAVNPEVIQDQVTTWKDAIQKLGPVRETLLHFKPPWELSLGKRLFNAAVELGPGEVLVPNRVWVYFVKPRADGRLVPVSITRDYSSGQYHDQVHSDLVLVFDPQSGGLIRHAVVNTINPELAADFARNNSRDNLTPESTNDVTAGKSTLADVALAFGAPEEIHTEPPLWIYRWKRRGEGLMSFSLGSGGGVSGPERRHALAVLFDNRGVAVWARYRTSGFGNLTAEEFLKGE